MKKHHSRGETQTVLSFQSSPLQGTPPRGPILSGPLQSVRSLQPPASNDVSTVSSRPLSTTTLSTELTEFIGQLRLACAQNAFNTLSDPRVSLDSTRNKFQFLLSLMNRESLTSYYKASLKARLDRSDLDDWAAVPFSG